MTAEAEEPDDEDEDAEAQATSEPPEPAGSPTQRGFLDPLLEIDTRSLALFRLGFGLLMLGNLARHLPEVSTWFLDSGVAPREVLLQRTQPLSLFFLVGTMPGVVAGLVLCGIVFLAYFVGYQTRSAQILTCFALVALHGRVEVAEHAGERVMNIFAIFSVFLPLGRHFSVDAVLAARRAGHPETPLAPFPFRSIACIGITLQIGCIYLFDCLAKNGDSWLHGYAIYYALTETTNTWLGSLLRDRLPLTAYNVLTWSTLAIEATLPFLVLLPWNSRTPRRVAIVLMLALHVGIRSFMDLGVFQPMMIVLAPFLLGPEEWEELSARLPRVGELADRVRGWVLDRTKHVGPSADGGATDSKSPAWTRGRELAAGAWTTWMMVLVLAGNAAVPEPLRPDWAGPLRNAAWQLGIFEAWVHYAPNPPTTPGLLVVEAETADGRLVDPVGEASYRHQGPPLTEVPSIIHLTHLWWNYEKVIQNPRYRYLWRPLKRWILHYPQRTGRPDDRIVRFTVYWMSWHLPGVGRGGPDPPRRRELFHYPE